MSLGMYYFGHYPANRIEFVRRRNLQVHPGPSDQHFGISNDES